MQPDRLPTSDFDLPSCQPLVMKKLYPICFLLGLFGASCSSDQAKDTSTAPVPTAFQDAPSWSKDAIWYQIFVERFRNGDPSNDPRPEDMVGAYPGYIPDNWSVTPWSHDWYAREEWQKDLQVEGFYPATQARRFGGDLQGVLDKMDYIEELGVNAIYFNPLNDAPSLHKYDARTYRHIDRNFGPEPDRDIEIMASENPEDPSTWKWTTADSLFWQLVAACKKRGIRVILDYSWNHTGTEFFALKDIQEKGDKSPYRDWFHILSLDDPNTPENEFEFEGWAGTKTLAVVNKAITPEEDEEMPFEGNLVSSSLKEHMFAISRRWLDPNGDGDPSDGIDGFRLDVAGEVPQGFWRDYRKSIREINPEAYLVGEIWWQTWPDSFMNPRPFLAGDQFDAIMNYRWYRIARGFFAQAGPVLKPSEFVAGIERINQNISTDKLQAMMNVSASHDTPRLSTSLFNKNLNKYKAKPNDDPAYKIHKPDAKTQQEQKLLLLNQFTFIGAPQIWNGDELGMWGADDPDCRKPMWWRDINYDPEKAHYFEGQKRPVDEVKIDEDLLAYYKSLTALRKAYPVLREGDLSFLLADDEAMTLVYQRTSENTEILVAFNRSERPQVIALSVEGSYERLLETASSSLSQADGRLTIELAGLQGVVLRKVR